MQVLPPLKRLLPDNTIESYNRSSFAYRSSKSTAEIVQSLAKDAIEPTIVKGDGIAMQGNTRVLVLQRRGIEVDTLPRVPYP